MTVDVAYSSINYKYALAVRGSARIARTLCVLALEDRGLRPGNGPVLVTGAAGGVRSVALATWPGSVVLRPVGLDAPAAAQPAEPGEPEQVA